MQQLLKKSKRTILDLTTVVILLAAKQNFEGGVVVT